LSLARKFKATTTMTEIPNTKTIHTHQKYKNPKRVINTTEVNNIGKSIWEKLTDQELKNKHYATEEAWRKNDKQIQIGDFGKPISTSTSPRGRKSIFVEVPKITKRAEKDPDTEVVKGYESYQRRFFKSKKKARKWAKKWKKQL